MAADRGRGRLPRRLRLADPRPDLPSTARTACTLVAWATWVLFALDYATRLWLSARRWRFVRGHLLDLAVIVLPALRPLRLLRLVTLLDVLNRRAGSSLRGRVGVYAAGATALVVFCGALAMLDAERGQPGSNIDDFGDALWWAAATVTTVGYGDAYPTTEVGRLVAVGLMVAGIALVGTVTASVASWLVQRVSEVEESAQTAPGPTCGRWPPR